ncbi:SgrR family transcriptional regulator [Brevibacillus borstelensis]|jgi:MarR-like DNA-binding transcriptional regulator SgrR of sgrS sRNA|uniref:SgrR family transcriptional regulator n=1 Tax=Brevibacillus borstelensis TaxID=45462 RepID=UPI00203B623D|nr:SgrR family transcriptional regulator [Brevibacillus borstelensis]MCM3559803.1 SgrR family transcriptional regulator [Brevibacillus borstelensis]
MLLFEHYHRLYSFFREQGVSRPISISLEQVASHLCCTKRNAATTVKKLQQRGWIDWRPGRGRGNQSTLTFRLQPGDVVLSLAQEMILRGDIRDGQELVALHQDEWEGLGEAFGRWMDSQFGLHVQKSHGKRLDMLRLFASRPQPILDPARLLMRSEANLVRHVFDGLVRFDPAYKTIEPGISFYWEVDNGGTAYTFYLRKGVRFHHGRALTAEDVRYSLLRLGKQASPHRWITRSIRQVEVIDSYVVKVMLHRPDFLFLHALSKEYAAIVPEDYTERMGEEFGRMPAGTGPFRIVRNDDSMLVMEAFEPYFGGRPFLDRIELWQVPERETAPELGQADIPRILYAPGEAGVDGETMRADWQTVYRIEQCFQYLACNAGKPGPLQDDSLREALDLIIDRPAMLAELGGDRQPAVHWSGSQVKPPEIERPREERIQQLLRQSGYRGETLSLFTMPEYDHVEDAEWLQKRLGRYGIKLAIHYVEPEVLASQQMRGADLILDSANMDEREHLSLLEFLFDDSAALSHFLSPGFADEVMERVERGCAAADEEQITQKMQELMKWIASQRLFLPLYSNRIEAMADSRLGGISLGAYGWPDLCRIVVRT